MPDETSAALWDLRAQCEGMLREITRSQKCLEEYKDGDPEALREVRGGLAKLADAATLMRQSVDEAATHVAALPEQYDRPRRA